MSETKPRRRLLVAGVLAGALILFAIYIGVKSSGASRQKQLLADGSTLMLEPPFFGATNFQYRYESANRFLRAVAPILPPGIRRHIDFSGGSFAYGGDGSTNLYVVSIMQFKNPAIPSSRSRTPGRLRVVDEAGDQFDVEWGANTLGMQDRVVHGWLARAFPRRTRTISLQFLTQDAIGGWMNMAEFRIRNPAFANYPQWTPEPLPVSRQDGSLTVTLRDFQSGARMSGLRGVGPQTTAPRKTRLQFTFDEDGRPATNWMVQKLTISDATGNQWFPYLDFVNQDFNWAKGGTIEFFGALWPGEHAWKLKVEVTRTSGFEPEDLWEVPLELPSPGRVHSLTNELQRADHTLKLVAFASPNTDHKGDFKWVAKWWGEDKGRVYSLALQLNGEWRGWRVTLARAVDQSGSPIKLMQHGSQDERKQALFLRPNDDSTQLRLSFVLQRSRFLEFLAQPEFVHDSVTNRLTRAKP